MPVKKKKKPIKIKKALKVKKFKKQKPLASEEISPIETEEDDTKIEDEVDEVGIKSTTAVDDDEF